MKFNPDRPWILGQQTKRGFVYFTDRSSPFSPDAWSPDIRKAARFTGEQAINMREQHLGACVDMLENIEASLAHGE